MISAEIESELVDLPEMEAAEYLRDLGVSESGVGALIRAVYRLLGLRTYLTTAKKKHGHGQFMPATKRRRLRELSIRISSADLSRRK